MSRPNPSTQESNKLKEKNVDPQPSHSSSSCFLPSSNPPYDRLKRIDNNSSKSQSETESESQSGGGRGGDRIASSSFNLTIDRVERELQRAFDGLGAPVSNCFDREFAARIGASLMFGEILFTGVTRVLDRQHLNGETARSLVDLGSGCGRLCVQAFLQFPNIEQVLGVELTTTRGAVGFKALYRLVNSPPREFGNRAMLEQVNYPAEICTLHLFPKPHQPNRMRSIELRQMNLFDCREAWTADILIAETNIAKALHYDFIRFLSHCKPGCRLLTYNNLEEMYQNLDNDDDIPNQSLNTNCSPNSDSLQYDCKESSFSAAKSRPPFPWRRLKVNTPTDKFDTSWGRIHFHLFECVANDDHQQMLSTIEKDKKSTGPVRSIGRAQSNFSSQIMHGAQSGKPSASKQSDEENQDDDQIEHSDEDDQCVKEDDSDLEVE